MLTSPSISLFIKSDTRNHLQFLEIIFLVILVSLLAGVFKLPMLLFMMVQGFYYVPICLYSIYKISSKIIGFSLLAISIPLVLFSMRQLHKNYSFDEPSLALIGISLVFVSTLWMIRVDLHPAVNSSQSYARRIYICLQAYVASIFLTCQILRIEVNLRYALVALLVSLGLIISPMNRFQTLMVISAFIGLLANSQVVLINGFVTFWSEQ